MVELFLSKQHLKILALLTCYLSDVTLVAWIYFQTTNYKNYGIAVGQKLESPDFQLQFYQVLLQSLTFALLLFICAQTFIYVLGWRHLRSALLYLKYFSVLGFAVALYITFASSFYAFLPAIFYLFGYYTFAKAFKESTAVMQTLPQ
jgi:hypothetical protein